MLLPVRNCIVLLFVSFFLQGCIQGQKIIHQQLSPLPAEGICKVGVIPFQNESNHVNGDIIAYRIFLSELQSKIPGASILEGEILRTYRQLKISRKTDLTLDQMRMVASTLDATILIIGKVATMATGNGPDGNPEFAVLLTIYDLKSNTILTSTYLARDGEHYRTILHYGKISTLTTLAQQTYKEILALWEKDGFFACHQ